MAKFAKKLTRVNAKQYFLEACSFDPADDGDIVSLPFMGFRGVQNPCPAAEETNL